VFIIVMTTVADEY